MISSAGRLFEIRSQRSDGKQFADRQRRRNINFAKNSTVREDDKTQEETRCLTDADLFITGFGCRYTPRTAVPERAVKAEKAAKPEPPPFQKRPGAMQLPDGRVLTFRPPKEGEFRIVHSHGSTYKCDHLGNWEDITPKPIFDNTFEETLVGLATTGNFIPGMLMGIDYDDAIKMLTKPVVINPDDPEDVVEKKEAVAAAKEAILDYMKDGASLDDFVMEMRKQVVKERFIRGMALKEIVASLKEGRAKDAADMRDAANKMLENDNLRPMNLPAHIEQAIEENK